jgi:hypothetical protein
MLNDCTYLIDKNVDLDLQVIHILIIIKDLNLPLFVILKIIFLILVSRWCELVEPWRCSRSCLRTPYGIPHLPHCRGLRSLSANF